MSANWKMSSKKAHETARNTLKSTQRVMKRNYDVRVLERSYTEGDAVYIFGNCKKLSSPWKGPGIITKKITPALFRVKLKNSIFTVNHDRDRVLPKWLTDYRTNPEQGETQPIIDDSLYCICQQPWGKQFMIQCDYCGEWFHERCVNISPTDALEIDKYRCCQC